MKKFFYIFSTIVALGVLASCVKETPYEPGPKDLEGCYGVFFPTQDASGSHIYDPTMEKVVTITVGRENTDDNITVPVVVTSDTPDMFVVDDVTFAAGQAEATFDVSFPNIETAKEYSFTISVQDPKYASLYKAKAASLDFSVLCVEWKKFAGKDAAADAQGHIYENNASAYLKTPLDFDAELWYHDTAYEGIRYCEIRGAFQLAEANYVFYWNTKTDVLYVPQQFIGIIDEESLYVGAACDFYNAYQGWGEVCPSDEYFEWAPAWLKKNNFFQPYYDKNGGFYLGDWLYICEGDVATGYGYQFGGDEKTCDLYLAPGFTRVDYSIEAETDYSYDGEVPVYFTTGADVAEIKYFVADAELTATQAGRIVDAIIAGTQEGVQSISGDDIEFDEEEGLGYSGLSLSFEKSGLYSVVAVTFDEKGEGHESATVTVNYIAAEDEEANAVLIDVKAEAVPEMYGMDPYTTLAFRVSGQNLTEVHLGIFQAAKFDVNPNLYLSTLKYDAENYAVDEETLATINAMGGLYDYADKLTANTEYIVVAWATNGKLDAIAYDYYATPRLPYVWNSLGKGVYTEDVVAAIYGYGADPKGDGSDYKTFDVEVEVFQENTNKNLYMFDPSLAVAAKFFDVTETLMANYEGGNWRHAQIILDCTDPTSVIWEEQDYGVCLSSQDGFIDGVTNMYNGSPFSKGIFSNGVISFPTPKGMLCTIGGDGYYYADISGKTKLVLPTAAKAAEAKAAVVPANNNSFDGKEFSIHNSVKAMERTRINIEREVKAAEFSAKTVAPKMDRKSGSSNREIKKYTPIAM